MQNFDGHVVRNHCQSTTSWSINAQHQTKLHHSVSERVSQPASKIHRHWVKWNFWSLRFGILPDNSTFAMTWESLIKSLSLLYFCLTFHSKVNDENCKQNVWNDDDDDDDDVWCNLIPNSKWRAEKLLWHVKSFPRKKKHFHRIKKTQHKNSSNKPKALNLQQKKRCLKKI